MKNRISKQAKAIADRHLEAIRTGSFDDPQVSTREEVIAGLLAGKTFSKVVDEIENRLIPVGPIMISRILKHESKSYRAGIYKGFKILIDKK